MMVLRLLFEVFSWSSIEVILLGLEKMEPTTMVVELLEPQRESLDRAAAGGHQKQSRRHWRQSQAGQ